MGRPADLSCHPLRLERDRRGLTLAGLSALTGGAVGVPRLSEYERGLKRPQAANVDRLAAALSVTPETVSEWFREPYARGAALTAREVEAVAAVLAELPEGACAEEQALIRAALGREVSRWRHQVPTAKCPDCGRFCTASCERCAA